MLSFAKIYCIGLYWLSVIFTIVYILEHVTPIDQPLVLLISFYSGYEGAGKAISGCIDIILSMLHLKRKYHIDAAVQYSTKV